MFLSFVRTHTKFGIKIFEIDFVIEIKWYLTFWPRGRGQNFFFYVARHIHVSNSHTKFGWISSNVLGGDSITDGRTDRRTESIAISRSFFLKKRGDNKPRVYKSIKLHSFALRNIPVWNSLPSEVVNSKTVVEFKTKLDKLWRSQRFDQTTKIY